MYTLFKMNSALILYLSTVLFYQVTLPFLYQFVLIVSLVYPLKLDLFFPYNLYFKYLLKFQMNY